MIKVGIVGISGYSGEKTLELLLKHPEVRVTYVSANNTKGKISDIWPQLAGKTNLFCSKFDIKKVVALCDLIFLAVPHTVRHIAEDFVRRPRLRRGRCLVRPWLHA